MSTPPAQPPQYDPASAPRSGFAVIQCPIARTLATRGAMSETTHGCVVYNKRDIHHLGTVHGVRSTLASTSFFFKPVDHSRAPYYAELADLLFVGPPPGQDRPALLTRGDDVHPLSILGWTVVFDGRPMTVVSYDFDAQMHELCAPGRWRDSPIAVDFGGATVTVITPPSVQTLVVNALDTLAAASRAARLTDAATNKRRAPEPGPSDFIIPPTNGDLAALAGPPAQSSSSSSGTVASASQPAPLPPRVFAPAAQPAQPPATAQARAPVTIRDGLVTELSRRAKVVLRAHRESVLATTVAIVRDVVPGSSRLVPNVAPSDAAAASTRTDGATTWTLPLTPATTIGDVRRVVDAMPGLGPVAPRHVLTLMTRSEPLADDVRVCSLAPDIAIPEARVVRLRARYDDRGPEESMVIVFAFDRTPYAIRVAISSTRTIRVVRETIAAATDIPVSEIGLIYNGRALGDSDIVGHTGLGMLSIVAVIVPEKYHLALCEQLGSE